MKKTVTTLYVAVGVLSSAAANDDLYVGLQASSSSTGFSIKKDINYNVALQGIFDILGNRTSYSARGIYKFKHDPFWDIYGFGEFGLWSWDKSYHHKEDETVSGYGFGIGVEYDMRGLSMSMPPVFVSVELDYYFINFDDNYYYDNDENDLGLGFGVHYKF